MSVQFDTIWPADSVEFCPDPTLNIFACGTYKLLEGQTDVGQQRVGQCLIYRWSSEPNDPAISAKKIQEVDLPAVLDMKWSHKSLSGRPLLGIADSEGNITLHEWDQDEPHVRKVSSIQVAPSSDILCLSLDWSNRRSSASEPGRIVVSLSNGELSVLDPEHTSNESTAPRSWHAHDYEPWIAAWDYWDPNVVYSGGDDLKLKGWDLREDLHRPTFLNKRFDAGVTTIQCHPYREHLIAVGSYDSRVRLFDTRKPQIPVTEINVGGGVWRVKWHPHEVRKDDLLVACMHDGFKVVRFDLNNAGTELGDISKRYDGHGSLAYGVDWSFNQGQGDQSVIASCSFYDHSLHLWRA
ncbi:hypothetical protein AAF712_000898 [Marasmius tenuissimus]|uniref:methylated diphthine methylhydrolase n=1 Tax=Marasmius tenuissimus TaxID=585030 RepID=A0ABR3AEL2_9AGAR